MAPVDQRIDPVWRLGSEETALPLAYSAPRIEIRPISNIHPALHRLAGSRHKGLL